MDRVIAYIDGFNLYFGLKDKGWRRYYWLNAHLLMQNLLKPHQKLVRTKYFTARITSPPDKAARQSTYIEALQTLSGFEFSWGHYQFNPTKCRKCGFEDQLPNEKMTDVNIAIEMIKDAHDDRFDVVLLVSGDSDLVPAVKAVKQLFSPKRVVIAFPPKRVSIDLARSADNHFVIGRAKIARSLFPENVTKQDGSVLKCPPLWK